MVVYDLQILTGQRSPVLHLAFSPDAQTLVSGDEAGYINFRNASAGHCPFLRTRPRPLQSPFHLTGIRPSVPRKEHRRLLAESDCESPRTRRI